MELVDSTVTMQEFIEKWLPKTNFSLRDLERQAQKAIGSIPQQELRVVVGETCFHLPCWSIAVYLGLASPCRTKQEAEEAEVAATPEPEGPAEDAVEDIPEDEDHVSTDPIGLDDTPPESEEKVEEKRKPGRPRKA